MRFVLASLAMLPLVLALCELAFLLISAAGRAWRRRAR